MGGANSLLSLEISIKIKVVIKDLSNFNSWNRIGVELSIELQIT